MAHTYSEACPGRYIVRAAAAQFCGQLFDKKEYEGRLVLSEPRVRVSWGYRTVKLRFGDGIFEDRFCGWRFFREGIGYRRWYCEKKYEV